MEQVPDALDRALAQEPVRNAEQFARWRFVGVLSVLAMNAAFLATRPQFLGAPMLPVALYAVVAGALTWAMGRSERVARWSALAIPFVDMPAILLLILEVVTHLRDTRFIVDVPAVGVQLPLFYLLVILGAASVMSPSQTWLTAGVGVILQSAFLLRQGRDTSFVAIIGLATVLGTQLATYARRRGVALVEVAVLEQTRRQRLGRYFSPQVAAALAESDSELGKGESREVTVLFADIRDFTRLSEPLAGEEVVRLLNDFHSRMVGRIFAAGGTLDKYIGDGLMAYFGAPISQADHAGRAVRCSLEMQESLAELNRDRDSRGLPPLRMGIGLHSGSVVLGDIGAPERREYTVIGDTVNVAARIEQLTKAYDIPVLVSDATRHRVDAGFTFTAVEPITVRGKSTPIQTYRVRRADD